jgi:hypothetical protein
MAASRATPARRPRLCLVAPPVAPVSLGSGHDLPVYPPATTRTAPSLEEDVPQHVREAKKDASQHGGVSGSTSLEKPAEKDGRRTDWLEVVIAKPFAMLGERGISAIAVADRPHGFGCSLGAGIGILYSSPNTSLSRIEVNGLAIVIVVWLLCACP